MGVVWGRWRRGGWLLGWGGCDVVGGVVVWIGFVSRMRRVVVYGWLV